MQQEDTDSRYGMKRNNHLDFAGSCLTLGTLRVTYAAADATDAAEVLQGTDCLLNPF